MGSSLNHFSRQSDKILEILKTAAGSWVPLPEIQACAAQYNARIFELRKRGHRIENRTQLVGDSRHSWFRLVPLDASLPSPPKPAATEVAWKDRKRVTGLELWDAAR